MSLVEKWMNWEDLHAYKIRDFNEYSMVPGYNSKRKFMPIIHKRDPVHIQEWYL